ncbi:uncharacterized protein CTRU02_213187 [Colletotrichum truncatum]|uniref:Uncharacterized protein n=1 Tax=Colletotrichum truncatum TaxID=5467 RepID=A0ACC3YK27_COLTU|nr:uncharacterized protein CTRU02_03506 [Colletotrichum truncatum]KAF6797475.1 hypothetical protein CTRU02_03506 [Colletotrichum truncatum]
MMPTKAQAHGRWVGPSTIFFVLPIAILYILTPTLNGLWKSLTSAEHDQYAGELARAATSEASWLRSVRRRHDWMEKNRKYDGTLFTPRDESFLYWYTIWDFFPATYTCPWDVQRVGTLGDGGKWICGMSKYEKVARPLRVYSFGVGDDSSFEAEMLNRSTKAEVWGFDDTVDGWEPGLEQDYPNRTQFLKTAVAGYDFYDEKDNTEFLSIKSIMKKLGHDYVDLIKMDIEGDEFPALESFLEEFSRGGDREGEEVPIGQLVIEIHVPDKGPRISQFADWWERIENAGFRPVWSEANLLAVTVGDGKPCCTEYTWINTRDGKSVLWNRG